jgi:predicted Ser/Thr protein kinase
MTEHDHVLVQHLSAASERVEPEDLGELRARVAPLLPGYELHEALGRGGMGAVFRARQVRLDREVAIKVLQRDPTPGWDERFVREARALAKLTHPGIVAVHDFDQAEGLAWIVMEYVDGTNLRQLLEDGKLSPEEALTIASGIAAALAYAHGEGVVHRDVKPENVLLDRLGNVKLADFGLAKLTDEAPGLTRSDQALGTPRYMAPEQLDRSATVDHRADTFALGLVLYEMLTGEVPRGVIASPSKLVGVDPGVDEVVLRALAQQPERRYHDISEMAERLDEIRTARSFEGRGPRSVDDSLGVPASKRATGAAELQDTSRGQEVASRLGLLADLFVALGNVALGFMLWLVTVKDTATFALALVFRSMQELTMFAPLIAALILGRARRPVWLPLVRVAAGTLSLLLTQVVSMVFAGQESHDDGALTSLIFLFQRTLAGLLILSGALTRIEPTGWTWAPTTWPRFQGAWIACACLGAIIAGMPWETRWDSGFQVLFVPLFAAVVLYLLRGGSSAGLRTMVRSKAIAMASLALVLPLLVILVQPGVPEVGGAPAGLLHAGLTIAVLGGVLAAGLPPRSAGAANKRGVVPIGRAS